MFVRARLKEEVAVGFKQYWVVSNVTRLRKITYPQE